MPVPALKSLAKRAHKKLGTLERYWDEAKSAAAQHGLKTQDPSFWAYTMAIVKKRAGLGKKPSLKEFLAVTEEMGKPRTFKIEKGLSMEQAMKACPWKKEYGDCRAFGYDPKTGEAVWH